ARNTFTRAQQLHSRGLMSQVDYDTADTRLKVAEANYQAAIDNVRSLKASLQDRRAAGPARRVHSREHAGCDDRADAPAQVEERHPGAARRPHQTRPGGAVLR